MNHILYYQIGHVFLTQLAVAVEFTDCFSAEG